LQENKVTGDLNNKFWFIFCYNPLKDVPKIIKEFNGFGEPEPGLFRGSWRRCNKLIKTAPRSQEPGLFRESQSQRQ
jgi:hypothetical protein